MKKSTRNIIIFSTIGFCLIVVGGIIAGIGFGSNGSFSMEQANYGIFSLPRWSDGSDSNNHFHSSLESSVHTLNIRGDVGDLEIIKGDTLSIDGSNVEADSIKLSENNGVLDVKLTHNKRFIIFGFIPERKVVIRVPETVKTIDGNLNVGDLTVRNIDTEQLKLEHDVGDVELQNVTADTIDLSVHTGDMDFIGDFKNTMTVKSNVGDVDLRLGGAMNDYDYDIISNLGDLSVGSEHQSGANRKFKESSGTGRLLRMKNDLGDTEIAFQKW